MKKSNSGIFDFRQLSKNIDSFSELGGILCDGKYGEVTEWIQTGNYALNGLISGDIFKGIPAGKITVFSGPSQTGKTFLALNCAREAQLMGYDIIWLDSENAFDKNSAIINFLIDPNKFRHEIVNTIEEVSSYCKKLTELLKEKKKEGFEIPKIMIVLDSIGNLSTEKEVTDVLDANQKADMTRAKGIKRFFRVMTSECAKLNIPMVCINHVYANIGSFFGGNIQSGGSGVEYLASINVELSKSQIKESETAKSNKIGIQVTCKLAKARFSAPYKPIKFQILFNKGMNKYIGLECFLDEESYEKIGYGPGKFVKTSNSYKYSDTIPSKYWSDKEGINYSYKDIYCSSFFTEERLKELNELIVKDKLSYKGAELDKVSVIEEDIVSNDDIDSESESEYEDEREE